MPLIPRRYLIAGSTIAILFIGLIFWSARSAWIASNEVSSRHAEQILQRDGFLGEAGSTLVRLNNLLLIREFRPSQAKTNRARFETLAKELSEGLAKEESILPDNAKLGIIRDLKQDFQDYLETAYSFMDTSQNDNQLQDRLERMQLIREKAERIIITLNQISDSRAKEIESIFSEYKATQNRLYKFVLLLAVLAFLLTGAAIFIILQNRVANLRLDLARSKISHQKQERLASLGTLASGVAHEIRNPLTAIKARLFALDKRIEPTSDAHDQIKAISNEINRLEKIVKEFLLFARPPRPELKPFEVMPLLEQVSDLLQTELEERSLHLKISPSEGAMATGDTEQIKQILINLIQNAADASEKEDSILLETSEIANDNLQGGAGETAIYVIDQGAGMPENVAKNLFNPFFTTKPKGTGLGLSIAKRIAQANKGDLLFDSRLGEGTTFRLILPRSE
ncbi:MAG: signal transduction histidine kinase [Candidatus Pelagisphaera sp.]|jgi:signal transduction histidine kinase